MNQELKIKVCGMKFPENRQLVEQLGVDYLGFIFYPPSKRYAGDSPGDELFKTTIPKVGVFVNEKTDIILAAAEKFELSVIQLHGQETPGECRKLQAYGLKIIKAFNIFRNFNFDKTSEYEEITNFFLFDAQTDLPGGSGKKFDWQVLESYNGKTPFFLSGGITPEDAGTIKKITHPRLAGVDLNSGFEDSPGRKNTEKLKQFINSIK